MTVLTELVSNPREWWVELPTNLRQRCWHRSQYQSQPGRQWDAYLGQLCLHGLLPWLQENSTFGTVETELRHSDWPAVWDLVGGVSVLVGAEGEQRGEQGENSGVQLVLIPNDDIEAQDLVVPQEWVDLPDWAGHYYLAVQLHSEEDDTADESLPLQQWLRIWSYTSHRTLKRLGQYDPTTRSYMLSAPVLADDMTTLGPTLRYCGSRDSRAALEPLPQVSATQKEAMLEHLGNPEIVMPRLSIPFAQWGALIQDADWRQRLYERRCGSVAGQVNIQVTRLAQWLEGQFDAGWRSLEALLGPELTFTPQLRRSVETPEATGTVDASPVRRAKRIELSQGNNTVALALILLILPEPSETRERTEITPASATRSRIQVQLHPLQENTLPANVVLSLQVPDSLESESVEVVQSIESGSADNYLQLTPFTGEAGEQFQLRVIQTTDAEEASNEFLETFCL